jgi:hypothetical protein
MRLYVYLLELRLPEKWQTVPILKFKPTGGEGQAPPLNFEKKKVKIREDGNISNIIPTIISILTSILES